MPGSTMRLAGCLATGVALTCAAAAGAAAPSPKISARPHKVMVGAEMTLKGRGFAADTEIHLRECGRTFWLAPADPCLEDEVTVTTDAKGRFRTTFTAGLCPEGEATRKPTQRVCYVGQIVTGEDTGSLVGAARLIVTYP